MTGPALAGLRFGASAGGDPEIVEPVNVGLEASEVSTELRDLREDPDVIAAVVAPWTAPPTDAVTSLTAAGIPVVSLSWAWGPSDTGTWLSVAAGRTDEADLLLRAVSTAGGTSPACVAGDAHATSGPLVAEVVDRAVALGMEIRPAGTVDPGRTATADAVAVRLAELGCDTLLWTGGAEGAELLLPSAPGIRAVVGSSRLKTDAGLALAEGRPLRVIVACACEDVTLARDPPFQRFVHDFQATSGDAPGPFAVEASDVGRLLLDLADDPAATRATVTRGLGGLDGFDGLLRAYELGFDGSVDAPAAGSWRASGSRWLPLGGP